VFWQFHKTRIALVEVISNRLRLTCASEFLRLRTPNVHVTLLEGLCERPVKDVTPVRLNDFFDTIDIPVCTVWFEVGRCSCVLPDWDGHVIYPFLLKPEAHGGNKGRRMSLVLTLFIKERVGALQVRLHLTSVARAREPPLESAQFRELYANLQLSALIRPCQLLLLHQSHRRIHGHEEFAHPRRLSMHVAHLGIHVHANGDPSSLMLLSSVVLGCEEPKPT